MDQVNLRTDIYRRQSQRRRADVLESAGGRQSAMGGGRGAAGRQACALGRAEGNLRPGFKAYVEPDAKKRFDMWVEWQKVMVDQANHFILFQPVYQIAVRNIDRQVPADGGGLDAGSQRRDARVSWRVLNQHEERPHWPLFFAYPLKRRRSAALPVDFKILLCWRFTRVVSWYFGLALLRRIS